MFIYELWMDCCFLTDILVTFFTAIEKGDKIITNKKTIAVSYFKGWFFLDFVTSLPTQLLEQSGTETINL